MSLDDRKYIFDWAGAGAGAADKAVADLWAAKESLVAEGGAPMTAWYKYVEPLYKITQDKSAGVVAEMNRATVRLLPVKAADDFLNHLSDENVEQLTEAVSWLHAATGNLENVFSYSADELRRLAKDNLDYYDERVFAHTLYVLAAFKPEGEHAGAVMDMVRGGASFTEVAYSWNEFMLLRQMLLALWRNLGKLSAEDRAFLTQNYFYWSLVANIPVRAFWREYLLATEGPGGGETSRFLVEQLRANRETVPTRTDHASWQAFPETVKKYFLSAKPEAGGGFGQEEFIADFYANQPRRDLYAAWLREALNIILHLEAGDLAKGGVV